MLYTGHVTRFVSSNWLLFGYHEPFLSISSFGLYLLLPFFYLKQGVLHTLEKIPSELGWAVGDLGGLLCIPVLC